MNELIQQKIKELREVIEQELPESIVKFEVTFTGTNTNTSMQHKYKEDLEREGISMRNLKGNFIT